MGSFLLFISFSARKEANNNPCRLWMMYQRASRIGYILLAKEFGL